MRRPAINVTAKDQIRIDGELLPEKETARLWRYHKPDGLVVSHKDPQGRPTVFEKLREQLPRVVSIGRLDLNTEGLLLLTNDGELAGSSSCLPMAGSGATGSRAFGRPDPERWSA